MGYGEIGHIVQSNLRLGTAEEGSFLLTLAVRTPEGGYRFQEQAKR